MPAVRRSHDLKFKTRTIQMAEESGNNTLTDRSLNVSRINICFWIKIKEDLLENYSKNQTARKIRHNSDSRKIRSLKPIAE